MPNHVCMGAVLQCSFGVAPSSLVVLPTNKMLTSFVPAANIMDHKPMVNIMPFGMCMSLSNPTVASAINEILAICKQYNVPCGHPHVDAKNVESLIEQGFRWLMPAPVPSFAALELGRRVSGRV